MEKGKGKCIVCGNDEFAQGELMGHIICADVEDLEYFLSMDIHACTKCGLVQLTSKKVTP